MSATRTCVACGARGSQDGLLRLQACADGGLEMVARPRAGRSAYLHRRAECVEGLVRSRLLRRSLRRDIGRDDRERVIEYLRTRIVE